MEVWIFKFTGTTTKLVLETFPENFGSVKFCATEILFVETAMNDERHTFMLKVALKMYDRNLNHSVKYASPFLLLLALYRLATHFHCYVTSI